jgi:MerR family transcriptional regulator, redox-sensitive transcriptional activator SoxR
MDDGLLTIGELAARAGIAPSALRYYEDEGLIHAERSDAGHRRYRRATLRRVSFIVVAKELGLTLEEIGQALSSLPDGRTPTKDDWTELSQRWRPRVDQQIATLERLRDRLDACIGCGCLSLELCHLVNPDDRAAERGAGPRYVLDDEV